jgi:3-phenylpropionate/trans-cinnamate dioxygenase ferredoxin reductase subunit
MKHVAVVGASLAGLRAVEALRRRGHDAKITWIGAEPVLPYDRPPLSKQVLRGEWQPERAALKADYQKLDVEPELGRRATGLDAGARRLRLDDGRELGYDGLVVATGAAPRRLLGCDLEGVHTLRTLEDALAIRRVLERRPRVVIVGAGFIGLEVAASCRMLGLEVTLVELEPVPLAGLLGSVIGESIAGLHRDHGVELRGGVRVRRLIGERQVEGVEVDGDRVLPADLVVVGIGVAPTTEWLEGSGVALDDGVVCDDRCAASVPGIVACGDVARFTHGASGESLRIEHWSNAVEQADAAVRRLLEGPSAPPYAAVPYFWSDQYDAKIQFVGRTRGADAMRVIEGGVATKNLVAVYERAGKLCAALTVNKPASLIKLRRAIAEGTAFE